MRVLIVCPFFSPSSEYGGPASVAMGHALGLQAMGVEVTVATTDLLSLAPVRRWSEIQPPPKDRVHVVRFHGRTAVPSTVVRRLHANPIAFVFSEQAVWWARTSLRRFDVVHIHFAREPMATSIALVARHQHVPYFLQPHGMLARTQGVRGLLDKMVVSGIVRSAAGIIALNETESDALRRTFLLQRVAILGNPMTDFLMSTPERSGRITILFLARLHPRKRVDAFVRMSRQLADRGHDFRFVVAGPDSGTLASARALAEALGVQIEFKGPLEPAQARDEIARADVYVLPSVDEPYPMTVLEAMYAGTPAVITTGCQIHDLLSKAQAAIVTDPNPAALADGVEQALEPEVRRNLVRNAQTWIADNASTGSISRRLVDIYRTA